MLRSKVFPKAFIEGLLLLLLCLRPAFDFVCETIAFEQGGQGDLFHIAEVVGTATVWFLMILCNGLSLYVISSTLRHSTKAHRPH